MSIFNNKKFDLICSIGEDCACSMYLRKFNLQYASYPFDWLTKSNFNTRINLIINDFKDFCNKEDFEKLENIKGKIADDAYEIVKKRYERRINRFYKHIQKSKNILFVFWGRTDFIDNEKLKEYHKLLKNKFQNQNIYLLILENTPKQKEFIYNNISDFVLKIKYDMTSYDLNKPENACAGNVSLNDKIFKQLKVKKSISTYLRNSFFNLLVKFPTMLIPKKQTRRNFREKMKLLIFKED